MFKRFQSTLSRFPYPTPKEQVQHHQTRVSQIKEWFNTPRFQGIKRPYDAEFLASHQGSLPVAYPSSVQARKLFNLLNERLKEGKPVHTLGTIDPVQLTQNVQNQEVVYVSGWACSSVLTTTNEVSPDFGDYPYDTVPNQVERLFKAQLLHDRKSYHEWASLPAEERETTTRIDYLRPIIADADTGHGGIGSVMKLAKLFVERGASAIHLEDQLHGGKKCGHLGGKVIVPTSQHISRLIATRLQFDLMNAENLIIARTDSESGSLLSSVVDGRDHEFVLGIVNDARPLSEVLAEAESKGASISDLNRVESTWLQDNKLFTFNEAVQQRLSQINQSDKYEEFLKLTKDKNSNYESRKIYESLTNDQGLIFNWDAPKTREGYYLTKPSIDVAVKRVVEYAPYADLLWLETKTPNLKYAQEFASRIHAVYPDKKLVYNLSPSFNWSAHGFNDQDLKQFIWDLAKSGFVIQLVSLAGLHSNALSSWELSKSFKTEGMKAYVELVQKREKESGCDVLTHQKWSGNAYYDSLIGAVQGGNSMASSGGSDSTENQF
jgi:isocitrate lyase